MRRGLAFLAAVTTAALTVTLTLSSVSASSDTSVSAAHSVVQLQKELAALGYLPLTESFQWRYDEPSSLKALWKPGSYNVMTKGAVMEFQAANHLQIDGIAGPITWNALDNAYRNKHMNPYGYTYVLVSEKLPEKLQMWHNGKLVLTSLANTGIASRPTAVGTFPVYQRYYSQTMSGTNPDGTRYSDPGVPYVSYFYGGDAVHGFWRKNYGYPQSLGCVELPVANAKIAWSYMNYGTVVTVQKGGPVPTSNPTPQPQTQGSNASYPTLHEGMYSNAYVAKLQTLLGISADGAFGPQTLAAVRLFQQKHGLVVDGIVGPQTWSVLLHG